MVTTNEQNNSQISYKKTARYKAVKILNRYERSDAYIDKLLNNELRSGGLESRDKALLTELVNGIVRWKAKLDWILIGFYHGEYQKCLNIIKNAMRVGLYQILFMDRIPIPAAIFESVEIVKRIQGEKTAAIVNGVLRNIARNIHNIRYPKIEDDRTYYYAILHSHQKWMVKRWMDRFGEENIEQLLARNNEHPPTSVRVNMMKANVEDIIELFNVHNLEFQRVPEMDCSLYLYNTKFDITSTDLYNTGKISIQDPSATLASRLTNAQPGDVVYDLCAAPGGKSFYIAEMMKNQGRVIACDKYESKLSIIERGKERLGFDIIETLEADAEVYKSDEKADVVICDSPCSGFGIIAKKPDIKWARDIDDLKKIVNLQKSILKNAAELVKPGGALVYSTCTIEPEENTEVADWFLETHPEFELDPADQYLPERYCKDGMLQTFPHLHGIDGAFGVRFVRKV